MTTLDTLIDYKQLVEAFADAVIVADSSGAIRFWNPAAERLFGFAEGEALGDSLDLIVLERFRDRRPKSRKRLAELKQRERINTTETNALEEE